jgi:transcriptional regulator with XRE-family HTH domain
VNTPLEASEIRSLLQEIDDIVLASAASFAEDVGVSYDSWRSWRTGRRNPTVKNLRALAQALEAKADSIRSLAERVSRLARSHSHARKRRSS